MPAALPYALVQHRARRCLAMLALVLLAGVVRGHVSSAAVASVAVSAQVLSVTSLDMSGCTGSAVAVGTIPAGTARVTQDDCAITFGSSNDTTTLRAFQTDGRGTALGAFNAAPTLYRGAPVYWGVAAASATQAWVVGSPATPGAAAPIMYTDDGGATWTSQTPCTGATYLTAADAVSSTTVVAVGTGNIVCRTTDAGATWTRITPPVSASWYTVEMLPSGEGWAAGTGGRVIRTTDAGLTWTALPVGSSGWEIRDISAASSTVLYASLRDGGSPNNVYVGTSTDGGATWATFLLGNTIYGGWALSVAATSTTTALVTSVYGTWRTTDTGATWTRTDTSPMYCIAALDANTIVSVVGSTSSAAIRRSTDGGATWTSRLLPGSDAITFGCAAGSASTLFVGGYNDQRLVSTDAGVNFVRAPSTYRHQNAAAAWSGDRYVTVGNAGSVRRSTDGSSILLPDSGTTATLYDVETTGAATAVAVGSLGTIIRSTDSAATWTTVASGTTALLKALDRVPGGRRLYVVGGAGTVLSSDDDGATWTARTAPTTQLLNDVVALGPNELWVAGGGGVIFRSTDAGATWTTQSSGTTISISSIDSHDGTTAFATVANDGTNRGALLATTDGGATWQLTPAPSGNFYYAVRFLDASTLVIASNAKYLRSTDRGATWTTHTPPAVTPTNIYAIAPLDANTFIMTGLSDFIMRAAPTTAFADYVSGVTDFSGSASTFGACLHTASGVGSTSWPLAGSGNCTTTNLTAWRGIARDAGQPTADIAGTSLGTTATVKLLFGAKASTTHTPGTSAASITIEVVAPNA